MRLTRSPTTPASRLPVSSAAPSSSEFIPMLFRLLYRSRALARETREAPPSSPPRPPPSLVRFSGRGEFIPRVRRQGSTRSQSGTRAGRRQGERRWCAQKASSEAPPLSCLCSVCVVSCHIIRHTSIYLSSRGSSSFSSRPPKIEESSNSARNRSPSYIFPHTPHTHHKHQRTRPKKQAAGHHAEV